MRVSSIELWAYQVGLTWDFTDWVEFWLVAGSWLWQWHPPSVGSSADFWQSVILLGGSFHPSSFLLKEPPWQYCKRTCCQIFALKKINVRRWFGEEVVFPTCHHAHCTLQSKQYRFAAKQAVQVCCKAIESAAKPSNNFQQSKQRFAAENWHLCLRQCVKNDLHYVSYYEAHLWWTDFATSWIRCLELCHSLCGNTHLWSL